MFIQMVQGACGQQDDMRMLVDDWCGEMADQPGWLGGTYGFTDDDRFVGVVRWDSKAACDSYCAREGSAWWWAGACEVMDGDPEVHQSEDVTLMLQGGSDDAGFVQVMQGKVGDAELLRRLTSDQEMTAMLHQARPDIIGSTLIIEDDGTFVETIAFTDEASARVAEKKDMPAEVSADMETAMRDVNYIDLHHPWFGRHH